MTSTPPDLPQDPLARQLRNILDAMAATGRSIAECAARLEAQGYRLVSGEEWQSLDDDTLTWSYRDYRTGKVLCRGTGTMEREDAAMETAERQDGRLWYHVDRIATDPGFEDPDPVPVEGIPASLIDVLREWAEFSVAGSATDEELAGLTGLSLERVRELRGTDPDAPTGPSGLSPAPRRAP